MRRIQTIGFKLSIMISIIITFIIPATITKGGSIIEYSFGFPFRYLCIYQLNESNLNLFVNLFNGNKGMNINIFELFINVVIIYFLLLLIKKFYINIRGIKSQ
ncbi:MULTISPECIES: hypothetical protein [Clostridium]|uniref:Uncharacterized protein n=1 Tax=Clostridium aquiflavi TaxID=3073603 RepID=A0ABU1EDC4_9CLOT|nr:MULTISPECIES: hypothetical protein [unclassified Clostridium]MDR5586304.1 hypothetical protein [Clostridium sp. 5N-1]NFG63208.1 hypothetical protein [Clostridium botulinum]